MEMPEGWKQLKKAVILIDYDVYDESIGEEAAEIMKAMAEALEQYSGYEPMIQDQKNAKYPVGPHKENKALEVLKKFKEWK